MHTSPTLYFGPTEYDESTVLFLPEGLVGFPGEQRFLPLRQPTLDPLVFLQSLATPDLCFLSLPWSLFDAEIRPTLTAADRISLGLDESDAGTNLLFLVLVSCQEGRLGTANLLAPVCINPHLQRGAQVVQTESRYSHCHPLPAALAREATC